MNLKEDLRAENKIVKPGAASWDWEMTRTIAALYNSGGGVLRAGVDDKGKAIGFNNVGDYEPDKGALVTTLAKYLNPVPPFSRPTQQDGYVEVRINNGVTFPVVLKEKLIKPNNQGQDQKVYATGTVFIRRMNGNQVSTEPLEKPNDWQTALNLWEINRGVSIQAPLVAQFCLVINKWDPFNAGDFENKKWEAKCVADTAEILGRKKLWDGLNRIVNQMQRSPRPATSDEQKIKDAEGSAYKQGLLEQVRQLCRDLDLTPVNDQNESRTMRS